MNDQKQFLDLSIVIPALNEADNLSTLLPEIKEVLEQLPISYEIIIIDELANDHMKKVASDNEVILLSPDLLGYGTSLIAGINSAKGKYILTMDADFSHPAQFIKKLWENRVKAEVIIASRYVQGGKAIMPISRYILSKILNIFFSRGLDLKIKDMSSGFRLYQKDMIQNQQIGNQNFDILQELLVRSLVEGYRIYEIPFEYHPRRLGSSHARVFKFGIDYLKTFVRLWKLRNSIASADYDSRAFNSWLVPQRYWQRKRFKYVTEFINHHNEIIDVGCGTSKILGALPKGSIALDILFRKLRYARVYNQPRLQASALCLPIKSNSFKCVICSQVIEHLPRTSVLDELDRVLKPGGQLILGTPDYDRWQWNAIERIYKLILPQAYADEHITHYTIEDLYHEFVRKRGYKLEGKKYILKGELILSLIKPANGIKMF